MHFKGANVKIVSTSWAPITEEQWKQYLINVTSNFNFGFNENTTLSLEDPGPGMDYSICSAFLTVQTYFAKRCVSTFS